MNKSETFDLESHPKNESYTGWLDKYYLAGYPGLVLSVLDSAGRLWQGARGFAEVESAIPLLPCHRHHSASVSKTYIAFLVLKLHQEGVLDLDAPLGDYLSINFEIDNFECVTIRQLLGHKSGIFDYDTNPKIFVDYLNNPFQVSHWTEIISRYVAGEKANFSCGAHTKYSDTNYTLLGVLLEKVTGKSLGMIMNEKLLTPFALTETYYKASPGYPRIPATANSYFYFAEDRLQNCTEWQEHFADIAMGHEGVIASPPDYAKFLSMLIDGELLPSVIMDEMMTFSLPVDSDTRLGLGLEQRITPYGAIFGHSGGGFGTMTLLFREPDTETTFFVGTNLGSIFESSAGEVFYQELLFDLVKIIKSDLD